MKKEISHRHAFVVGFISILALAFLFWARGHLPITIAFDPNENKCLPDVNLALLVHSAPSDFRKIDYVFFQPPHQLQYVKQDFVFKKIAGRPGDHLQIYGQKVVVNGIVVASGFPLASFYPDKKFDRSEIIPPGKLFMIGTAANSDDSRYWGYLDQGAVEGYAYKIW